MKMNKFNSILLVCLLIMATLFSTACDDSFYLSEKEFYALRGQLATQNVANQVFGNMQGQLLQINFNNAVSPPRVQSSNLESFMRNGLPTLAILEGYPSNSLQIARVSSEIEAQLDNWLAAQLRLYGGANNAQVRLERVEQMRIQFSNNPTFIYSDNKIIFNTTLQVSGDCRIRIDALDPVTNFLFGGVNGTYDVSIDINNLQIRGEFAFDSSGVAPTTNSSNLRFKMTPTVGSVVVRDRGVVTPTVVKNGIRDVVKQSLKSPLEERSNQQYDYFALSNCRIYGEFTCEYNSRPASSNPELHAVVRGTDNKLYAAVRRNDVWSNYTQICCNPSPPIQINFTSDPSLAVSGAGTIELAATISSGELFYAQYQNGWKNYRFILPPQAQSFRGKPAIVATAPGQIEVFVMRADNKVLHLRRINGNWTAPVLVNLPSAVGTLPNVTFVTYRDPVAVQSGNKIFLTAVASNNRIYAKVFDVETGFWGQSSQITTPETVNFVPALASSGDGRIDLAYVGQSGNTYHRPLDINAVNIPSGATTTGFALLTETMLPSNVNASPMLVASGYRQLGLIARGTDNHLYYNHFVGTKSPTGLIDGRNITQGWSGWGGLNGNFYGTQLFANEYTEELAFSATKTGKLDVVARLRANSFNTTYTLHHNSFDASDYGRQPWKTIYWRGYQKIGSQAFNGRPALAALDGNFEVAFVGQGNNIYEAPYGESFAPLLGLQILSNPAPVDPIAVSSGKGLVDLIAVGTDRKIKQIRYFNNFNLQTTTLPGQTTLSFQSRPALVGYGDGQLDVIGVSTSGSIHHWRFVNGIWQNPQQISGSVISSPILVHTGGGQLEFFAIGGDNKMYRWRFLGGAWGNWQQIPSTFTINASRFGQGAATTSGDGTVDLAVVSNQAGASVYHRLVEPRDDTISLPNMPAQTFRNIGSWANSQPFVGAFNKNEKFVVVSDAFSSDFKYYSLNNSTNWQYSVLRGNNLGLQIGGIANLPNRAVAVATDANGKIYFHNQFTAESPRFDFMPVTRQTLQSQLSSPRYRPTVASFGGQ